MRYETVVLYGDCCPVERRREVLFGRPVAYGIAQMAMTPFFTHWVAAGDIVTYNEGYRLTSVILRNSRLHFGRFSVDGLNKMQVCRQSGRLGRFLTCHLVGWTFVPRLAGTFSMSVDVRMPLERLMDVADQCPVPFQIIPIPSIGHD